MINDLTLQCAVLMAERKTLEKRLNDAEHTIEDCASRIEVLTATQQLLREVAIGAKNIVTETIDPLGTKALKEIFGPEAVMRTEFTTTDSGASYARIVTGVGAQHGNPVTTDGSSVAELISDAVLRPLIIALHNPPLSRICILDEPFTGVDSSNIEYLGGFLESLHEYVGMQIILTTHELSHILDRYANVVNVEGV
jgi:hypothetical protein